MKNIYVIYIVLISFFTGLTACDDFLDAEPEDKATENSFWKTETDVTKFVTDIYAETFPIVYEGCMFFDEAMSDNAYLQWEGWYTNIKLIANGTQDAYGTAAFNMWEQHYTNIRKCWQVLENMDKVEEIDPVAKETLLAEVRFLMAYNYHRLTLFFGDVPLVEKVLTMDESKEISRSSKETVITFILGQLDQASAALSGKVMEKGRITWGACQALKARVYLNQNKYNELLTVTEGLLNRYSLHTDGEHPYEDLFSGAAEDASEIILSIVRDKSAGSIKTGHYSNQIFMLKGMSGGDALLAITPSGSLVDSYPMADGRLIHEKGSGYDPKDPYKDRDPRFYQSVIYPTGQIYYLDGNNVASTLYDPEDASTIIEQQYNAKEPSPTGYMWNKYVDWSPYAITQITDCTNDLILIRYADVLLMHAEALAETQGAGAKNQVLDILDQLRIRCKGGLIHRENYNSQEEIIQLVRNERRIELANEGLRYFDLLRWRIAENAPVTDGYGMKGELYGAFMRLDGVGQGDRTVQIDGVPRRYVETRHFDPAKHYLLPIPQKERDLNSNLTQNPGW